MRILLVIAVLVSAVGHASAGEEPLRAVAAVDGRTIAIGDTFNLHIALDWEEGVEIKPLAIGDRIGDFIVRDLREGPASATGARLTRRISLLLTVFETGSQTIPPIPVMYKDPQGSIRKAETMPIEIVVGSMLAEGAADIRDIKDPISVPKRWKDLILSYMLLVGLAAGAAASVLVSVKRKHEIEILLRRAWRRVTDPLRRLIVWLLTVLGLARRGAPVSRIFDVTVTEPNLIPEDAALKDLERIEALALRERGMIKDYYSLVSETIRRYLERKFHVLALESPTSYTLHAVSDMGISADGYGITREVLEEADLVKFAKFVVADEAVATLVERARNVVYLTGVPAATQQSES